MDTLSCWLERCEGGSICFLASFTHTHTHKLCTIIHNEKKIKLDLWVRQCFRPRVSLKNASTFITLCLMGFEEICPPYHFGHGLGKVLIIDTHEVTRKAGQTHTHTHTSYDSANWYLIHGLIKIGRSYDLQEISNKLWLKYYGEPHPPIMTENVSNIGIWKSLCADVPDICVCCSGPGPAGQLSPLCNGRKLHGSQLLIIRKNKPNIPLFYTSSHTKAHRFQWLYVLFLTLT